MTPVNGVEPIRAQCGNGGDAAADAGFIAENVYLFCASEGLAVVVRGSIDREALAVALGLAPHQRVILAQTVGYPLARR